MNMVTNWWTYIDTSYSSRVWMSFGCRSLPVLQSLWVLDKDVLTCIHHYNILQSLFTALKILYGTVYLPLWPSPPGATTDLFTVSTVLPFPGCHRLGIRQFGAFSGQLSSLGSMCCKFPWSELMAWELISFWCWVIISHRLDGPQFLYPLTYWRAPWLLPSFGSYE